MRLHQVTNLKLTKLQSSKGHRRAEKLLNVVSRLSGGGLYEVERQARDMSDEDRWRIRQEKAAPLVKALHDWMLT